MSASPERPLRFRVAGRLLAAALALPSALLLLGGFAGGAQVAAGAPVAGGAAGASAVLVLAAFLLPRVLGGRDDRRVLAAAIGASLVLPGVPVLFGVLPFELERVAVHGALATLAWRGALAPHPTRSAWTRCARLVLLAWLAWSLGSAARGLFASLPPDAPWLGHVLASGLERLLAATPMTESTRPLAALLLRFDTIAVAWAALELGTRSGSEPENETEPSAASAAATRLARALARALAWAVPLALLVAAAELWMGSSWRGEDFLARLGRGLPRSHRPLADHNALGSALLLVLPALAWAAWPGARGARDTTGAPGTNGTPRRRLPAAALACGAVLLFSSRSKSAFAGLAVAAIVAALAALPLVARRRRRWLLALACLPVLVVAVVNVLPDPVLQRIGATRRGEDFLRVTHVRELVAYFSRNRVAVWEGGAELVAGSPVLGVGLGTFPRRLADVHDPARPGFNPLHENAHDQYLQWAGEDGLVGLLLALGVFLGALAGGARALRGPPAGPGGEAGARGELVAWTAALAGLFVNLVAGHALLVPTVAYLWAAGAGLLGAAGAGAAHAGDERRLPRLAPAGLGALLLVPLAALPFTARAPLEGFATGCHPWVLMPEATPDRQRVLEPDARWVQRWGAGSRMILPLDDPRPVEPGAAGSIGSAPRLGGEQRVSVALNGEWVIRDRSLVATRGAGRAPEYLKLDAPPGVSAGDLVRVRVLSSVGFAETQLFGKSRDLVAVRMLPPVFREPR